jgi:hypothetical protein
MYHLFTYRRGDMWRPLYVLTIAKQLNSTGGDRFMHCTETGYGYLLNKDGEMENGLQNK